MTIQVGSRAREDNVLALASDVASRLMLQSASMGRKRQVRWLRRELNKAGTGLGEKFGSRYAEFTRRGRGQGQSLFDALRITLANFFAENLMKYAARKGISVSGLGALGSKTTKWLADAACGAAAFGAGGYAIYAGSQGQAGQGQAVMNTTQQSLQMAGCGRKDARIQAQIAQSQADQADAEARLEHERNVGQSNAGSGNLVKYGLIGGGVLLVGILGVVILKKK